MNKYNRVAKSILKSDVECVDAAQVAILHAYTSFQTLKDAYYFKTWLVRILIHEYWELYLQNHYFLLENEGEIYSRMKNPVGVPGKPNSFVLEFPAIHPGENVKISTTFLTNKEIFWYTLVEDWFIFSIFINICFFLFNNLYY